MKLLVYSISFLFPKSLISVTKILLFSILQVHQLLIMYCVIKKKKKTITSFLSITFPSLRNLPRIFYYHCYQIVIISYGVWLSHSYSLSLSFSFVYIFFLFSFPSRLGWRIFNTAWKLSTRCKQRRQREQRTRKRKLSKKKKKIPSSVIQNYVKKHSDTAVFNINNQREKKKSSCFRLSLLLC